MFSSKSKGKNTVASTTISTSGAVSVLTAGTSIEGNIDTEMDLRLEGSIRGDVSVNGKVVLGNTGMIEGSMTATEAVIHGRIKGNLFINGLLHLASTAVIEGDISATQFSVDEGAVYQGKCNIGSTS